MLKSMTNVVSEWLFHSVFSASRRYVLDSLRNKVQNKPGGVSFVNEMEGDNNQFDVFATYEQKRSLLGQILLADVKKIYVSDVPGGFHVTKTNQALFHYDAIYDCRPLQVTKDDRNRRSPEGIQHTQHNLNNQNKFCRYLTRLHCLQTWLLK